MSLIEKQSLMEQFRSAALDILVATPVIEVGIDVPNASVILRGPGDFFRGTRQSGLPPLKNVRLDDYALMQVARQEAKLLIDADPTLSLHPELSQQVRNFTQTVNDDITDEAS